MSRLTIPRPNALPVVAPDQDLVCTWQISVHLPLAGQHRRWVDAEAAGQALDGQLARLQRVREIVTVLTESFRGWTARQSPQEYVLEIESDLTDAPSVEATLREHGVGPDEAAVRVQYARRWGIL